MRAWRRLGTRVWCRGSALRLYAVQGLYGHTDAQQSLPHENWEDSPETTTGPVCDQGKLYVFHILHAKTDAESC